MKYLRLVSAILVIVAIAFGAISCQKTSEHKKIGIILPLEHQAMQEISAGFTERLATIYHQPVTVKIVNAQNDPNLMRALILQLRDEKYDIIAPVGTAATQMTISLVKDQAIIGIASDLSDTERHHNNHCNATAVNDEISTSQQIDFIHQIFPKIKNLSLIYSPADKIFPEVDEAVRAATKYNIKINKIMAQNLPDLVSASKNLPKTTDAIFILKDSLIVSGISIIAKEAETRKIPLISSDDGSVANGAAIALGVHEKEIGVNGADLAAAILKGASPCALPIKTMQKLTVFYNRNAMKLENINLDEVKVNLRRYHYLIEEVHHA